MWARTWGSNGWVGDTVVRRATLEELVCWMVIWLVPHTGKLGAGGAMVVSVVRNYCGGGEREGKESGGDEGEGA